MKWLLEHLFKYIKLRTLLDVIGPMIATWAITNANTWGDNIASDAHADSVRAAGLKVVDEWIGKFSATKAGQATDVDEDFKTLIHKIVRDYPSSQYVNAVNQLDALRDKATLISGPVSSKLVELIDAAKKNMIR